MKKIALDLDGVVFDTENLYRVYTEIYDVDYFKGDSIIDNSKRIYQNRYNWSEEECQKFYSKYACEVLKNANIMTGADIVLEKLRQKNYEFIVVTARSDNEIIYARHFFDQLKLNIKIFNNEKDKIEKLKEEQVDYIIDDDDNICIESSKNKINALYFKNNASGSIEENEYLKIVHNWGEIYKYIILKEGENK